jgi:hypothetical protein
MLYIIITTTRIRILPPPWQNNFLSSKRLSIIHSSLLHSPPSLFTEANHPP